MKIEIKPVYEINRQAYDILLKEMGVANTIRFLNQFTKGQGDYTAEREKWLDKITLEDAISQIKSKRDKNDS